MKPHAYHPRRRRITTMFPPRQLVGTFALPMQLCHHSCFLRIWMLAKGMITLLHVETNHLSCQASPLVAARNAENASVVHLLLYHAGPHIQGQFDQ
jgi:hypothetical protein